MAKTIVGLTSGKEFTVDEEVGGGWPPHSKNRPLGVVHRRRPAAADRSATVAFLREAAELEPAEDLSPRGPAPYASRGVQLGMTTSTLVREREILEVALEKLGVLYL